ncbi:MAG TPA: hypothetical protein ENI60_06320 [Candidatus Fraserbacteria bacterium]|nr:hypothetical protein [Candidatus Fraserbacteria bacterium]
MKVLLDESLPRRLKDALEGHDVSTVRDEDWDGKKNGELLELASGRFDVFVTPDQGFEHQQNLRRIDMGVIVLIAKTNRLVDYLPLVSRLLDALASRAAWPDHPRLRLTGRCT